MIHLDPGRWNTISDLLDHLLDLAAEEREAYLDEACGEDAELRAEVLRVWKTMEEDEDGDSWEQGLLGGALGDQLLSESDADDLLPGAVVGAYRVLHEIGHGGMGTVYLAERADGAYEQHVALKRIRRGLDTKAVLRRFLHERQVLARLEHPNIARLLDAGVTADGLPYFVMEYVEGEPITDYCDRHRLPVRERLTLFDAVCRAVRYAHQNLVVHRDLKPSNVLVMEGEDGPVVKLLDFGIAKVLHEEDGPELTQAGGRVLTPEYGAPEQARGEAVTTATDVYALGVMLYELLAGQRPHRAASLEAGGQPRRPSSVVSETPVAEGRRATVPQLRKLLRGDLDHIVLKALREEPERRYGTAEELRQDLQRHRDGFPVEAHAESIGYRVSRFVRRHRVSVAATAAVAVALIVGLGVALWQANRAEREAARARTEAATAAQASAFLTDLFKSADPTADPATLGDSISVRTLVERGRERIAAELEGQPLVQANLLRVLGEVYLNLGLYGEGEVLLARSDSLYDLTPTASAFEHAQTLTLLGTARRDGGDIEAAAAPFEKALTLSEQIDAPNERARVLRDFGLFRYHQGLYDEAEALARRALADVRPVAREDSFTLDETYTLLGLTLYAAERYDEAEAVHRDGHRLALQLYGPSHPNRAKAANNLAGVLRQQGRADEAERYYREALAVYRQANEETHPIIARSLNNLGVFLVGQGRMEEGEAVLREALDLYRRRLGEDHPEVALGLVNVAGLRRRQGDYADALGLYDRALTIQRARLDPDHFHLGRTLNSSALTAALAGDHDRAARHYAEAVRIFLSTFGTDHARTLGAQLGLGRAYLALNRRAEAREVLLAAREGLPAEADSTLRADILAALDEAG